MWAHFIPKERRTRTKTQKKDKNNQKDKELESYDRPTRMSYSDGAVSERRRAPSLVCVWSRAAVPPQVLMVRLLAHGLLDVLAAAVRGLDDRDLFLDREAQFRFRDPGLWLRLRVCVRLRMRMRLLRACAP